jgi:predicted nucleic acid-binding protein
MARKTEHRPRKAAGSQKTAIEAYVDTSAFIAFLDRSDSYHQIFSRLFSEPPSLVTSALVVAEGHGWFLRRYDRRRATDFLAFVEMLNPLSIQGFDSAELAKCGQMLASFRDQNLTLADAHGLVIMKDRRPGICWSTDRHLGLTGVKLAISN